jgi:hypothetical protein
MLLGEVKAASCPFCSYVIMHVFRSVTIDCEDGNVAEVELLEELTVFIF